MREQINNRVAERDPLREAPAEMNPVETISPLWVPDTQIRLLADRGRCFRISAQPRRGLHDAAEVTRGSARWCDPAVNE